MIMKFPWLATAIVIAILSFAVEKIQIDETPSNSEQKIVVDQPIDRPSYKAEAVDGLITGELNKSKSPNSYSLLIDYMTWVNPNLTNAEAEKILFVVIGECSKYENVSPDLVLFTMEIESSFDPKARSKNGAIGLMQVNPRVWLNKNNPKHLGNIGIKNRDQLRSISGSIESGVWILNECIEECMTSTSDKNDITGCASRKYFGTNREWYFDRVKKAAGNFWFFTQTHEKESLFKSIPVIIEANKFKKKMTKSVM